MANFQKNNNQKAQAVAVNSPAEISGDDAFSALDLETGTVADGTKLPHLTFSNEPQTYSPVVSIEEVSEGIVVQAAISEEKAQLVEPLTTKYSTAPVSEECKELLNVIDRSDNRHAKDCVDGFISYIEEMQPGRQMDSATGARHQVGLFRLFEFLINSDSGDFNNTFAVVLKIVDDNIEKTFGPRYAHRFTDAMNCKKADIDAFNRFMNLLTTASSVKGRAEAIKQIDFSKTLELAFNDAGRQRVLGFFNI